MTDRFTHGGDIPVRYDFSVNLNPLGMPDSAKAAYRGAEDELDRYPDRHASELCRIISEKEGIPSEHILCGAGAADLIYRTVYAERPKKAFILRPSFTEYERALLSAGCEIQYAGKDISDKIQDDTDIVFVCSPCNPTGLRIPADMLIKLSEICRERGARLVIDESFIFFCEEGNPTDALVENGAVIIRSLTKIYAMPALRVGYLVCKDSEFLERAALCGQSWGIGTAAMRAAEAALGESGFERRTAGYIKQEREYLTDGLRSCGLTVFPSEVNFILVKTDLPLAEMLYGYDIAVRDCTDMFGEDGYFRIAVRTHEENKYLLEAVRRCTDPTGRDRKTEL